MHIRVQKYAAKLRNKKKDTMESPNMKLLRKVGLSGVKFSIVDASLFTFVFINLLPTLYKGDTTVG